jgi:transcriptional regulator with XRE-family HTH domain
VIAVAAALPQESSAQAAEAAVGRRLRLLRRSRELSLQAVARTTGLSIGLLSQIERGLSSPSVKNLVALSNAFDVPISWFFDEAVSADEGEHSFVVRREARSRIAMQTTSMSKELLSPDRTRPLQTFLITVEPGGGTGEQPYAYSGEVNGYVLAGRLALWLNGRSLLLREGDSFAIPGNCPRRYGNPDPFQSTRLIWTIAR